MNGGTARFVTPIAPSDNTYENHTHHGHNSPIFDQDRESLPLLETQNDLFGDPFDGDLEEPVDLWVNPTNFAYREVDQESDVEEDITDESFKNWLEENIDDEEDWERVFHNTGKNLRGCPSHFYGIRLLT